MSERQPSGLHALIKERLQEAGLPDNGVTVQTMETGRWNEEQNRLYEELSKIIGGQWKLMSLYITSRTSEQIRSHGQKVEKKKKLEQEVKKSKEMSENLEKYEEKTGHRATRSRLKRGSYYQRNINREQPQKKQKKPLQEDNYKNQESPKQGRERNSQRKQITQPRDRLPKNSYMRKFLDYSKASENHGLPRFPNFTINNKEIETRESAKQAWIKTEFHDDDSS